MWASKTVFITSISLIILLISSTHLAGAEPPFSVSPDEFTVLKAPPLGESYTIPQKLVVWNRDNVERLVFVTSETPPENAVRPGYEPIPNENWVHPLPSSILIPENSYAEVQISLNIPRWENLTGKKWEVWIPVERQPLLGEVGVLRPTVRIKIETTEELPPLSELPLQLYIVVAIVAGAVAGALGLWVWLKRRPRKRRSKSRVLR
jgi:hypothetical protein